MDKDKNCPGWARRGYCKGKYEEWMKKNCMKSCNLAAAVMVDQENVVINRVQESWMEKRLLKELGRGKHKSEVLQVLHSVEEHWSILSGL